MIGRFYGELDPAAPLNSGIVDLGKVPRNANGMVEYSSDFYILKPLDLSKGNGAILYDVNNRGNKLALYQFNSAPLVNDPTRRPDNKLLVSYKQYAYIKYCNEIRQGYLIVFINDIELDRARTAVKAIEIDVLNEKDDIDTDAIWERADSEIRGQFVNRDQCQSELNRLLQQYAGIRPADTFMKKDF